MPHAPTASPLSEPREQLPTATIMAKKEVMEKASTLYMNEKGSRGELVMWNRTTKVVEDFDRTRGSISEDWTGDQIFVNR